MIHPLRAAEPHCSVIETSAQLDDCIQKDTINSEITLVNELKNFESRVGQLYSADQALGQEFFSVFEKLKTFGWFFVIKIARLKCLKSKKTRPRTEPLSIIALYT